MKIETVTDRGSVKVLRRCGKSERCLKSRCNKMNDALAVEYEDTSRKEVTMLEFESIEN